MMTGGSLIPALSLGAEWYNRLFPWLEECTRKSCEVPTEGLLVYGLFIGGTSILLVTIVMAVIRRRNEDEISTQGRSELDTPEGHTVRDAQNIGGSNGGPGFESDTDYLGGLESNPQTAGTDLGVLDDRDQRNVSLIAPAGVTEKRETAIVGSNLTKTLWAESWPETPPTGFLQGLWTQPGIDADISLHIEPRNTNKAISQLDTRIGELKADVARKRERGAVDARGLEKDLRDAQQMYDILRNSPTELFDASMYVTIRDEDPEGLEQQYRTVTGHLQTAPTNIVPKTATHRQLKAMQSNSPIGWDFLNKKTTMMGGAIGAMFPFASGTFIEESGVEYGQHKVNGSPVIVDRFARDRGYNKLVAGEIGSGKSVSASLQFIRMAEKNPELNIVMLDPLEGFVGVNEALNGERIVVGGNVGLNPLEIRKPPEDVLERMDEGIDLFNAKLKDVISFFEFYFETRDKTLEDSRGILEQSVKEAYTRAGITHDPVTHSERSPKIADVLDILREISLDPESFAAGSAETEAELRSRYASQLLIDLEPFTEGGEYENLTKETEIDFRDEKIVYLDLQQQEGRGGTGLMMQILFNSVYERAKQDSDPMIFAIDEARYIMKGSSNLEFLEQAVRHSRHYNLSIEFITQTVDEFFERSEAEAIAKNTSLKELHQIENLAPETAEVLGLNDRQADFVRNATPGKEEQGYSEALLQIGNEGWYPIRVKANELEMRIVTGNIEN